MTPQYSNRALTFQDSSGLFWVVSALYRSLRCVQKEMAINRLWSVFLWTLSASWLASRTQHFTLDAIPVATLQIYLGLEPVHCMLDLILVPVYFVSCACHEP